VNSICHSQEVHIIHRYTSLRGLSVQATLHNIIYTLMYTPCCLRRELDLRPIVTLPLLVSVHYPYQVISRLLQLLLMAWLMTQPADHSISDFIYASVIFVTPLPLDM
jgi:hypothetical protein